MKRKFKALKIVLISLLTLLVLVVGLVCAALFTPLRNVLISKALESTLEAKVEVGDLRMKIFRTWPELSLDLSDISVTYPAPSDTVLGVSSLALRVNVPNVIHGFIDVPELALKGVRADLDWSDTLMLKHPDEPKDTLKEKKPFVLPRMRVNLSISDTDLDLLDYVKDLSLRLSLSAVNDGDDTELALLLTSPRIRAVTPAGRVSLRDFVLDVSAGNKAAVRTVARKEHSSDEYLQEQDFLSSDINIQLDSTLTALLGQWNPRVNLRFAKAAVRTPALPLRTRVDEFNASADLNGLSIDALKLRCGASDLDLTGSVTGVSDITTGSGQGEYNIALDIHSKMIQANQLLAALEKGKEASADSLTTDEDEDYDAVLEEDYISPEDTAARQLKLFVIPSNVNAEIHLQAERAIYSNICAEDLNARVRITERTAQVVDLKARTDFGAVSADAFYSTKSKKNINAGFDVKLQNITAEKLIDLVPAVDTLVPILSSFKGNLNCELAATTSLDTLYRPKLPTMEGAFRITGSELSLNQEGAFKKIAKILMFRDRKKGRIDSLYISGTVRNSQVRLYPFLLSLDRYSLALGGWQNFNGRFDYKVSLLRSPILIRFGVNLYGSDFSHLKWRLMKAQFKGVNVPSFHEDVDELLYAKQIAIKGVNGKLSDRIVGEGKVGKMEAKRAEDLALCDSAEYMSEEELEQMVRIPRLAPVPAPKLVPVPPADYHL
ncbi:MAG: AsmA-like C-terminal region-containing protein [Candidatus Cryptobacteroides sp.]